jgi:hypothetical protein
MPNTQERISKLLRFSPSLLNQKQGQVVDKMINALKITYEELKQRVVFGKQNEYLIPAMAFETVIAKFLGLENYGTDEILGEFMTEILTLADLHETTFTLEDDLLRHHQDREKSSIHFVQHLQNVREIRRYKQRRTEHLSSEIELEIKEMWTKNSHFVSLEIEQEWDRLIDLCSDKMLERGTVIDWIDDEMAENELPIVAKDFSIEMLERMVLIMRNGTYHKEASKEWKAGKSSLTFWLEHHDQSTAAWQLLKEVQVRALQLGTRLSHQLSCMVTMMIKSQSSHDNQGIVNSLEKFFMSLEKFTEAQQDNEVINKLIMEIESATHEVTRLNEGERPDGNRLKGLSEPVIETNYPEKTNELLEKILNQAMRLELVLSHPYIPDSTVLPTEVMLSLVEPFLSLIENQMTSFEQEIDELELPSSSTAAVSVFNSHMELKIKEICA